ncbi:PIN domain-containing protein [Actinosynnema sp. CA-248983]
MARTSYSAASMLAEAYSQDGHVDALVGVLRQAAEDFSDPQLRLEAASELRTAGRARETERELSALLGAALSGWPGVRDAQRLAAQIAVDDGRLEQAIDLLRTVVTAEPDSEPTRWALIDLLFRRAETPTAWRVYLKHHDGLEPSSSKEAHLWIDLHRWFDDPLDTLRGCLRLARRFPDSEEVVAHALTTLLSTPRLEVPILDAMAGEWRETTEEFFRRWPTSRWLRRIDVEQAVEELNAVARTSPELRRAIRDFFTKTVLGRVPLGVLAQLTSRRYSEVVLRHGTDVLQATHPIRREQTLCLATASSTAGSSVVLDTTAIVVLNTLPAAVRDLALGLFGGAVTADAVLLDARLADEILSRRGTASWQWNENTEAGGPVAGDQRHADQLAEESARLVKAIERLVRRARPAVRVAGDRDDTFYLPSMPVLDLAAAQQMPVWADDAGLRILARSLGLQALSTPAVLDALLNRKLLTPREHSDAIQTMLRAKVGDFEITDHQFLDTARAEDWNPDGAAAVALGRPAA